MNKKGITLIALTITIVILIIISSASFIVITRGNIIERSRTIRLNAKIEDAKDSLKTVMDKLIKEKNYGNVVELAGDIENELRKLKGFDDVKLSEDSYDYIVSVDNDIEFTIEEATGKKLELYIEKYITRTELESR